MFSYINSNLNKVKYNLGSLEKNIELTVVSLIAFLVPFLLGHIQLFVGVVVNAALITSAVHFKKANVAPAIIFPSLGVLAGGLMFGGFTSFLLYMIPFIWIGNLLLVVFMKDFYSKTNYFVSMVASAAIKTAFLFLSALVLYKLGFVPAPFLTAFGIMQFATAVIAGFIVYGKIRVRQYIRILKTV